MMREAQKMMADPAFQERMKQYTENDAFKASMAKTQEMLKDVPEGGTDSYGRDDWWHA